MLLLLAGSLCSAQSVLTTPADQTRSAADRPAPLQSGASSGAREIESASRRGSVESSVPVVEVGSAAPGIVSPLTAKSEFQQFAEDSAGETLPVYGRSLFDEVPTTFAPVERVPVPADYVLGPADELLIRAWGKIDLDARVAIDRNGQIYLPRVGTLNVAGLRYQQLEGYIHSAIGALFKDFELSVALGQLRSIQIFTLGSARRPGAYTVGSLSTLVNAIFSSGGPSATGSMRHIQLLRANRLLTEFDMYDLVQKGDKTHDAQLLPGDVIYIPAAGPQIAVGGAVNQPGIFELKGASTVASALEAAGGLTSLAGSERAVIERIEDRRQRRIEEFALDAAGLARPLQDGDLLRTFPLSPKFANAVTLQGSVARPGRYPWRAGMRVSDLIPSRTFLITRTFWNLQNHLVPHDPDPFGSRKGNSHNPGGSQQYRGRDPTQSGEGSPTSRAGGFADQRSETPAESSPAGEQNQLSQFRVINAIGQNSAEINWEYAVIERLDDRDLSPRLISFRLAEAIDNLGSAENQLLMAGDVITIFSRSELELPVDKHASFIRIGGEINAPGVYRVAPGETLRAVVERAGGPTSRSYLYAAQLTRLSTRHAEEAELRQSVEQMQRELLARFANAAPQPGQTGADQQAELGLQQAALARLAATPPTGRIVLDMNPDAAGSSDIPDFPLEDGDAFYVPTRLGTIQVVGAVYNANAFRLQPGKLLGAYLDDAGGPTREGDRKRIFVIHADGTVVSRQSRAEKAGGGFEKQRLLPGDAIVVPEKLRVSNKLGEFLQVTQFASQTALTAAALSTITK